VSAAPAPAPDPVVDAAHGGVLHRARHQLPLLVWLVCAAGTDPARADEDPGSAPHSGPADGGNRVTVVSRGSTVWNT